MPMSGKAYANRLMRDTLQIGTETQAGSGYGNDTSTSWAYDSDSPVECWVDKQQAREVDSEEGRGSGAPIMVTPIRVPVGTAITGVNRVKVTHLDGAAITNETYRVRGNPVRLRDSLQLNCSLVTGNSRA